MRGVLSVVASIVVAAAAPARAAAPPRDHAGPAALSLTVSGGVSLGAYEAGFLASASAAVRRDDAADLRLLTGASAGSLNALLALLATCGGEPPGAPAETLFWQTWIPVGFERLSGAKPTALGAFSREWLEHGAARIEAAWRRGVDRACDVVLGVSTTRVEPRVLRAAGGRLELPRMEEKFAIRVQGRGPGQAPRASNYVPPGGALPNPLLVTDAAGEIPFSELRDLLFASMAFPVAFPPQPLRTCVAGETAAAGVCLPAEATTAHYVDGGIFDNAPLRMAVGLARAGLHRPDPASPRLRWRPVPDPAATAVPASVAFAFLDPGAAEYPATPAPAAKAQEPSLPAELERILTALVETARAKELAVLMEEHPDVAGRLVVPRRHFPAASAPLFAFLGFFETEFRVFDFHLGMYDARRLLAAGVRTPDGALVVEPARAALPGPAGAGQERLACMSAAYDGAPEAVQACRGEALSDFRALLQVSLDQLYDACRAPGERADRPRWSNAHCDRAAAGEAPPRVPGVSPPRPPDWRRGAGEGELAYTTRLLAAYGFRFADLGVPPGRADLAVGRIRAEIGRAGRGLAAAQPGMHRGPVTIAAKLVADAVAYAPPDRTLHLTMGPTESEIGYSRGFSGVGWLPPGVRVAGALGFRGLEGALTSGDVAPFGILLAAGVEVQPPGNSSLAQLRLGTRAGWLFAADDALGAGTCEDRGVGSVSACTRPVVQAVAGFTLLERFRVQVVGEWFPGIARRSTAWSVAPGIGLELGF